MVVAAVLGEMPTDVPFTISGASQARVATGFLGLLTILQGVFIIARHRWGLHLVFLWSMWAGIMSSLYWVWIGEKVGFDWVTWAIYAAICCYAWLNRGWFANSTSRGAANG
jgi:hypothetical protein